MDATRKRRTKDRARQAWYARCRQRRFARFLGFGMSEPALPCIRPTAGACARLKVVFPGSLIGVLGGASPARYFGPVRG
jgi:hypothetical protein